MRSPPLLPESNVAHITLTMIRVDSIRKEARKEAWKNDSYNPFRKTIQKPTGKSMNRARTYDSNSRDLEAGDGVSDENNLRAIRTEPAPRSPSAADDEIDRVDHLSKPEEHEMTKANGGPTGRNSIPSSKSPILERPPTDGTGEEKTSQAEHHRFSLRHRAKKTDAEESRDDGEDHSKKSRGLFKGKELKHAPFTVRSQLQATIFNSWINILLLAAPVGIALHFTNVNNTAVFVVNFIAIIPLAAMLSFATEELSLHVGETLGGLLNASFG